MIVIVCQATNKPCIEAKSSTRNQLRSHKKYFIASKNSQSIDLILLHTHSRFKYHSALKSNSNSNNEYMKESVNTDWSNNGKQHGIDFQLKCFVFIEVSVPLSLHSWLDLFYHLYCQIIDYWCCCCYYSHLTRITHYDNSHV